MPSTPDPLIEVIARELHRWDGGGNDPDGLWWSSYADEARAMLTAITATGRLLPEGTKAHPEFATGPEGCRPGREWSRPTRARANADREIAFRRERWGVHQGAVVLARTVYETPWEPASTPDTTGTEEGA